MAVEESPRSETRKLYSWWWDSHISPKNSKWFKDNLADMDLKIKSMIKLIEEDADTFSRRAELYFKKRPELIELVEEFYRAYRALAERYDCATVELRQAHGPVIEPHRPAEPNNFAHLSAGEASVLRTVLEKIHAEKENLARNFHENLQKLFGLEREITDTGGFDEHASRSPVEISVLKDTMKKMMSERDDCLEKCNNCTSDEKEACFLRYSQSLEVVAILERLIAILERNSELAEGNEVALNSVISKIKEKDDELRNKERDLNELQTLLEEERSKASAAESSLSELRHLHDKFAREQQTITDELKKKLRILADLKEDSEATIENLKREIANLNETKARLEDGQRGVKSEKDTLLWQIQMMLDNIQKLSEKNALAENALLRANIEIENLRFKTAALEESCQALKDEKIAHLDERNSLGSRMGSLESKFSLLEEKYYDKGSDIEDTRVADAEVEIKVLHKFVEDLEQKNIALLFECQKHVESAKLTKKLIAEFEDENVEQQAEIEYLHHEIEKLRMGIRKIFKSLHLSSNEDIETLACSLQSTENDKHLLGIQNLVLLAFLDQRNEEMKKEFANLQLKNDKLSNQNLTLRRNMSALLGFRLNEEESASNVDFLLFKLSDKVMKQQMDIENLCRTNEEMSAKTREHKANEEKFLAEIQASAVRETLLANKIDELQDKVAFLENKIEHSRNRNFPEEDIFPPTPGFTDRFQVILQNSGSIEHESPGPWETKKENESRDIPLDEASECSSLDSQQWKPLRKRNAIVLSRARSRRTLSRNARSKRWNGIPELPMDRFLLPRTSSEEVREGFEDKRILERLESDAKRLISSELVVQELTKKLETKNKVKQVKNREVEIIKTRLIEAEDAILQLFSSTNQLAREIQTIQPNDGKEGAGEYGKVGIAERAMKGSEMVGCVQFEVENIESSMVSLLGGKKGKAKSKFPGRGILFKKPKDADEAKKWDSACLCGYGRRPMPED